MSDQVLFVGIAFLVGIYFGLVIAGLMIDYRERVAKREADSAFERITL